MVGLGQLTNALGKFPDSARVDNLAPATPPPAALRPTRSDMSRLRSAPLTTQLAEPAFARRAIARTEGRAPQTARHYCPTQPQLVLSHIDCCIQPIHLLPPYRMPELRPALRTSIRARLCVAAPSTVRVLLRVFGRNVRLPDGLARPRWLRAGAPSSSLLCRFRRQYTRVGTKFDSEIPVHFRPRRLADCGGLNPTGARKVHSLIDKVYQWKNLERAWERVRANRGSGGVDGQSLEAFGGAAQ